MSTDTSQESRSYYTTTEFIDELKLKFEIEGIRLLYFSREITN